MSSESSEQTSSTGGGDKGCSLGGESSAERNQTGELAAGSQSQGVNWLGASHPAICSSWHTRLKAHPHSQGPTSEPLQMTLQSLLLAPALEVVWQLLILKHLQTYCVMHPES